MAESPFRENSENINEAAFVLLRQALDSGTCLEFEVADISKSMYPLLIPGDKVTVGKVNINKISRGDIVIFRRQDALCMHRYIRKTRKAGVTEFVMKGDNMLEVDRPAVYAENILGRAVRIRKKGNCINMDNCCWRIGNFIVAIGTIVQIAIIRIAEPIAKSNKKIFFSFKAKSFLMFPLHFLVRLMLFFNKISLQLNQKLTRNII